MFENWQKLVSSYKIDLVQEKITFYTIIGCLQNRKHCKAIMDDLLLFTPSRKVHMAKLEDLLKALLKNGLKISPNNVSYLKQNYNTWGMSYLQEIEKFVLDP